jgi:ABC-type sugar transport system permease subunit
MKECLMGVTIFRKKNQLLTGYLLLIPALVCIFLFILFPMTQSFYYSLFKWDLLGNKVFIGLNNFKFLFKDPFFKRTMINSFLYMILSFSGTFILSMATALLMQSEVKVIRWARGAIFIPVVVPMAVMGLIWKMLYEPQFGVINQILGFFKIPPQQWLYSGKLALIAVVIFSIWKEFGLYTIILIGGLQKVPSELHEAAKIDGANSIQSFFKITIPSLKPIIFFVTTILLINSFKAFDHIWVMTQGGPGNATSVMVTFIYTRLYDSVGLASAASLVLFLIILIVTFARKKLTREEIY